MMIEFQCPACKAPLAVQRSSAGGQVDCPRCRELIFIPLSPAPENAQGKAPRESREETILRFVTPYLNELANKRAQLSEAIEEIKNRNQRIRELENIGLRVQRDLWSVEAEYEERRDDFRRLMEERLSGSPASPVSAAQEEKLRKEIERLAAQLADVEKSSSKTGAAQTRAESLRGEFQALQSSYETLAQRNSRAESELLRLREEVTGLSAGLAERRRMAVTAARTLAAFIEESEGARMSVEGEIRAIAELMSDPSETDLLEEVAGQLTDRAASLLKEAEQARIHQANQTRTANRTAGELEEQRHRADALQKNLAAAANRERDAAGRLEAAARESATARQSLQQEANDAREQMALAEKTLAATASALRETTASHDREKERTEGVSRELEDSRKAESRAREEAREESDRAKISAAALREQLETIRAKAKLLEQRLQEADTHRAASTERADKLQKSLAESEAARKSDGEAAARAEELSNRLAAELQARLDAAGLDTTATTRRLAETRRELDEARAQMSVLSMEVRRLGEELDRKERASREMSLLHQSHSNRIDHLTSEINAREIASEKAVREHATTTEENRLLKLELQRLRESGASLELIQPLVEEKVRALKEDYEQKLRDLQDRNKSLENHIENDRHNSERLMRAADQQRLLSGKIQVLENSLRELEALNTRLQQRVQELSDKP